MRHWRRSSPEVSFNPQFLLHRGRLSFCILASSGLPSRIKVFYHLCAWPGLLGCTPKEHHVCPKTCRTPGRSLASEATGTEQPLDRSTPCHRHQAASGHPSCVRVLPGQEHPSCPDNTQSCRLSLCVTGVASPAYNEQRTEAHKGALPPRSWPSTAQARESG